MAKSFHIPRYILWPLRLLMMAVILLGVTLGGLTWWLSTEDGKTYVDKLLQSELSDSIGYKITAEDIHFQFPLSAKIAHLSLADSKGVWAEASGVALHVLPTPNIQHHLVIRKVTTDSLTLHRTPESTSSSDSGSGMNISVLGVNIGKATISREVTGLAEDMIGSLQGSLGWAAASNALDFEASANIAQGIPGINSGTISASGKYLLDMDSLDFLALTLTSPKVSITGHGKIDLTSETLNLSLQSKPLSLSDWMKDISGTASAEAMLTGTFDQPALDAKIKTASVVYESKVLPDAAHHLTAKPEGDIWKGTLEISVSNDKFASSSYAWHEPSLTLENIVVTYGKNKASGELVIDTNSLLANGTIKAALPDLAVLSDFLPEKIAGSADVTTLLASDNAKQSAKVKADLSKISVHGVEATNAHVETWIPDINKMMPESVAFEATGLTYEGVTVDKASLHATPKGDSWNAILEAEGTAQKPFAIRANGNVAVKSPDEWNATLSSLSGKYDNYPFKTLETAILSKELDQLSVSAPRFSVGEGVFALKVKQRSENIEAKLSGNGIALSTFKPSLPESLKNSKATLALNVNGSLQSPQAEIVINLTDVKLHDQTKDGTISIKANVAGGNADIQTQLEGISSITSSAQIRVPVIFSFEPFALSLREKEAINGKAELALDVSALAGLLLSPDHALKGKAEGTFTLAGSIAEPSIQGELHIADGSYQFLPLGTELQHIRATIMANGNTFTLKDFAAQDKDGNKLTGSGSANIHSVDELSYQADIHAKNLSVIHHPNAKGTISGNLTLQGDQQKGNITGALISDALYIYLPDRFAGSVPALNVVETIPPPKEKKSQSLQADYPIALNVTWQADNKVFVRGWGLDAELKGDLALKGQTSHPEIEGKLSTIRGRYEEFGKRFDVKQGELVFEGDMPPSPYLNVTGSTTESGVEIKPVLSGPILKPALKIESSPAMPQEEALSTLLFGKDSSRISPLQAAQLANSLAKLSGKGGVGFDPLGKARDALGVDDIKVNGGGENAADTTVGVGKYIGDNVYLEVERGAQTGSSKARVEVEVTPSISVESTTGATGDSSVGVNWKYDY